MLNKFENFFDEEREEKLKSRATDKVQTRVNLMSEIHEGHYTADTDLLLDIDLASVPIADLLGLYMVEACQARLLTAEEEVYLAKLMEEGRHASHSLQEGSCNGREHQTKLVLIKQGEAAREQLIHSNTRLVISNAKKNRGAHDLSFIDLIQEGNIGLMIAIQKYDYRLGYRFSTYATWWIRQTIRRAIASQGRLIRIPHYLNASLPSLYQQREALVQENQREPTIMEIAKRTQQSSKRIRKLLITCRSPISMEAPINSTAKIELGELIADKNALQPIEVVAERMLAEEVEQALANLSRREAWILRLRYGLHDGQTRTLKEVGAILGLSRQRIRQLEKQAFHKLRYFDQNDRLYQYLS